MKAVVDYALSRPEVVPQRLAVCGYSGGFVPQAAMHDERIKAIAMNACVVDARSLFATMPVVKATQKEIDSWSSFHGNTVKLIAWRWGVPMDKPAGLVEANEGFRFDPARVAVPALVIVGEGEYRSEEVKSAGPHLSQRRARTAPGLWGRRQIPDRPPLARLPVVL